MKAALSPILALLFFSLNLAAQQPHPVTSTPDGCGYVGHSTWLDWYVQHRAEFKNDPARGADTAWLYVPVTVHAVGTNAGLGFARLAEATRNICEMNDRYAPSRIHFYFMPGEPMVYHKNDLWYKHDWNGGAEMIDETIIPNRLNAYIVDDPAGNCGYSWKDAIVLGRNCSGPGNSTWSHEAGHHFSLPHPFLGWEGRTYKQGEIAPDQIGQWAKVEKLDGSNCEKSGDFFCDTRPDYLSYRWQCDSARESTLDLRDPNNQIFRADATIIMGYAYDACATRFSDEQMAAMRENLRTEHVNYLTTAALGPLMDDNDRAELLSPIDTQTVQYNNFDVRWTPVPGADMYEVEISLNRSFSAVISTKAVLDGATTANIRANLPKNYTLYWRVKAYSFWDVCQPQQSLQTAIFKTVNLTATNDLERVASVELSPNPVSGGNPARLDVDISESLDAKIFVFDFAGRLVSSQAARLSFGANQLEIPTANLAMGNYQVQLQTAKGTVVKRLSVME